MAEKNLNVKTLYFNWLCQKVNTKYGASVKRYRNLLTYLSRRMFYYNIWLDESRYMDGVDLRDEFLYSALESPNALQGLSFKELREGPCSVLEMLVAFSQRIKFSIMYEEAGDDAGFWFWRMLDNLGLLIFDNANFNEREVGLIIDRWLNRNFKPNGEGGLFVIEGYKGDLREVDIWSHMQYYLTSLIRENNL